MDAIEISDVSDDEEESNRVPHNSQQWKQFKYVLPHEKTINKYTGLLAASEEAEAGILLNMAKGVYRW